MPKYILQKGFVVQKYSKKLVLFDSETSTMYTLNETAAFIFNQLKKGLAKKEIVQKLCKQYAVSAIKGHKDVTTTIQTLLRMKIFQASG